MYHERIGSGPHGHWTAYLKEHGIALAIANRAERLYLAARKRGGRSIQTRATAQPSLHLCIRQRPHV
jgi:hypothetical protein